jgi:lipoate-protein ligase A
MDEALLLSVEAGRCEPCIRLWESPRPVVVLGRSGRINDEVKVDACNRDGISILRRCTGGGTVLLGPGCMVFSLILPVTSVSGGPSGAAKQILQQFKNVFDSVMPGIEINGISDLTWMGQKFSGNSQRWLRKTILHHGTFLFQFPLEYISWYLKTPPRQPEYRRGREHTEFLTNVVMERDQVRHMIAEIWQAMRLSTFVPMDLTAQLVEEKYSRAEWNHKL